MQASVEKHDAIRERRASAEAEHRAQLAAFEANREAFRTAKRGAFGGRFKK